MNRKLIGILHHFDGGEGLSSSTIIHRPYALDPMIQRSYLHHGWAENHTLDGLLDLRLEAARRRHALSNGSDVQ